VPAADGGVVSCPASGHLRSRIQRILGQEEETMQVSRKLALLAPGALLGAAVAWGVLAPSGSRAEPAPPPEEPIAAESDIPSTEEDLTQPIKPGDRVELLRDADTAGNGAEQRALAALHRELEALRNELRNAQKERDKYFAKVIELTDRLQQLIAAQAKAREAELQQLIAAQAKAREAKEKEAMPRNAGPTGVLEGLVLDTWGEGVVEVSLGSDDGLQRGQRLDVCRQQDSTANYVGKIEVLESQAERSLCRIIPEFTKGAIRKGDRVLSKDGSR
jgi:hypothetical protein